MTWTVKLTSDELNVVTNALKQCAESAGDGAYGKDFHLRLARKVSLESSHSGYPLQGKYVSPDCL